MALAHEPDAMIISKGSIYLWVADPTPMTAAEIDCYNQFLVLKGANFSPFGNYNSLGDLESRLTLRTETADAEGLRSVSNLWRLSGHLWSDVKPLFPDGLIRSHRRLSAEKHVFPLSFGAAVIQHVTPTPHHYALHSKFEDVGKQCGLILFAFI